MNKKAISIVLLLLSFTLIVDDCSICTFSNTSKIKTCNTDPDISDHFEQLHFHNTGVCLILNETRKKVVSFLLGPGFIISSETGCLNKFISMIWQPPKI